jgi:hypothetical protein
MTDENTQKELYQSIMDSFEHIENSYDHSKTEASDPISEAISELPDQGQVLMYTKEIYDIRDKKVGVVGPVKDGENDAVRFIDQILREKQGFSWQTMGRKDAEVVAKLSAIIGFLVVTNIHVVMVVQDDLPTFLTGLSKDSIYCIRIQLQCKKAAAS